MRSARRGVIFDLIRYAVHDGPGIRTTVFFKGCPLECRWCQNPESLSRELETVTDLSRPKFSRLFISTERLKNVIGRRISAGQVMREVVKDRPFFDRSGGGVTFSGGEPLMQPAFLEALLGCCRAAGIDTALDTSGYAPWPVVDRIRPLVGLFLYDIKLMDERTHLEFTGVSNRLILDNLRRLVRKKARIHVRLPVIPGITDRRSNIRALAEFVARLKGIEAVSLLPYNFLCVDKYRRMGRKFQLGKIRPATPVLMERIKKDLAKQGIPVRTGGG